MTEERCKQIMEQLGMPNSRSLQQALYQVANETEQAVVAAERKRLVEAMFTAREDPIMALMSAREVLNWAIQQITEEME